MISKQKTGISSDFMHLPISFYLENCSNYNLWSFNNIIALVAGVLKFDQMFIGKLMQKKVLAGFGLIAHPRSYESNVIYCTFF